MQIGIFRVMFEAISPLNMVPHIVARKFNMTTLLCASYLLLPSNVV